MSSFDHEPRTLPDPDPSYERGYQPVQPGTDWRKVGGRIWAPIALVLGLAAKFGFATHDSSDDGGVGAVTIPPERVAHHRNGFGASGEILLT